MGGRDELLKVHTHKQPGSPIQDPKPSAVFACKPYEVSVAKQAAFGGQRKQDLPRAASRNACSVIEHDRACKQRVSWPAVD